MHRSHVCQRFIPGSNNKDIFSTAQSKTRTDLNRNKQNLLWFVIHLPERHQHNNYDKLFNCIYLSFSFTLYSYKVFGYSARPTLFALELIC